MYKIGNTSGLCDKTCDETKHTVKVVGDIVEKLAKKCCDVPKKMRAPSKVIEVTDGCFSSASVINVCDELGGGDSDSADGDAAAADGACDGAASTGGGCGGGKSSQQCNQDASQSSCNKGGGGCGGKSSQASKTSKCTGKKLADMKTPDATVE